MQANLTHCQRTASTWSCATIKFDHTNPCHKELTIKMREQVINKQDLDFTMGFRSEECNFLKKFLLFCLLCSLFRTGGVSQAQNQDSTAPSAYQIYTIIFQTRWSSVMEQFLCYADSWTELKKGLRQQAHLDLQHTFYFLVVYNTVTHNWDLYKFFYKQAFWTSRKEDAARYPEMCMIKAWDPSPSTAQSISLHECILNILGPSTENSICLKTFSSCHCLSLHREPRSPTERRCQTE